MLIDIMAPFDTWTLVVDEKHNAFQKVKKTMRTNLRYLLRANISVNRTNLE